MILLHLEVFHTSKKYVFLLEYEDFMHKKTHRHFVAFPIVVLLMLAVVGVQNMKPVVTADLTRTRTVRLHADVEPKDFTSGWLLSGVLDSHSVLVTDVRGEHMELLRGQALIRSTGLTTLLARETTIHALVSSYVVIVEHETITVVPLTAPLLLTHDETISVVVPGMQVMIDTVGQLKEATVPSEWYAQYVQASQRLMDVSITDSSDARSQKQAHLARIIMRDRITTETFADALGIANDLDPSGVAVQLLLVRLLQEHSRTDADVSAVLSTKISEDHFLASSLVSRLPVLVRTLMKPVAEPHIRLWEKSAVSRGLVDFASILSVLHDTAGFPAQLSFSGYPQQSLLWQHALSSVATTLRSTVSGQPLLDLQSALAVIARGELPQKPVDTVVETSQESSTHWSAEQLVAQAKNLLLLHGVLMTVTSQVLPDIHTQSVRVTGIYLAEQGRDVPYEFTIDMSRNILSHIVRDAIQLPNSVPVDVFFQ